MTELYLKLLSVKGGLNGIRTRVINLGCHGKIYQKVLICKFKDLQYGFKENIPI
jgi:hypothetical protein